MPAVTLCLCVFAATNLHAQAPLKVTPCQLVADPARYHQQTIQVRGRVSLGFENFTLDADCGKLGRGIWLAYGGDEPTPTKSTVNDEARTPGSAPKVNGKRILLRRDSSLEVFKNRLAAERVGHSAESICQERSCYLYNVTATITGIFLGATDKIDAFSGYGHLGCCHLLIIQAVDAVDAERTPVPAGGRFSCSHDVWNMDATTLENFARRNCLNRQDCESAFAEQLAKVATHWGDTIDLRDGNTFGYLMGLPRWVSHDLTKSYSLVIHREAGKVTGAEATRDICRATSPPFPPDVPISCRHLWSEFKVTKQEAKSIQRSPDAATGGWRRKSPEAASRIALDDAARRWGVNLVPNITSIGCDKPTLFKGDQITSCTWEDPESMQMLYVQMTRFGFLRQSKHWDTSPWILTGAYGTTCVAESPK
jgi:hypothetical protein